MLKNRIPGIEVVRIIAAFAVICIHFPPFLTGSQTVYGKWVGYGLSHLCRFAVPFFFLAAGYFYGKNTQEGQTHRSVFNKRIKRLLFLFFVWSLIYTLVPDFNVLARLISGSGQDVNLYQLFPLRERLYDKLEMVPWVFLFEGNTGHLWFFTALIAAYSLLYLFRFDRSGWKLCAVASALYVFGILNSNYSATPIGIRLPFIFFFRNGPFMSTLFLFLGYKLSFLKHPPAKKLSIALAMGGFVLQEVELIFLHRIYGVGLTFDYLVGTVPFACGIFLWARQSQPKEFGGGALIMLLSKSTLGIYLLHIMVASPIAVLVRPEMGWGRQLVFVVVVFVTSTLISLGLLNNRLTRRLVS